MEPTSEELLELVGRFNDVKVQLERTGTPGVKLVAVSKFKPAACILELYRAGHRDFGENYVQELVAKAAELPKDINWHFIGHLQSQKAKVLLRDVPNLHAMETIDSEKIASKLNSAVDPSARGPLNVFVQVCTSDEGTKSGISPAEAPGLCEYIVRHCPQLSLSGLMTIGAPGDCSCFDTLRECRNAVTEQLGVAADTLGLSMGMSADYCEAIARGSTSVRVGSTIFGARDYSKQDKPPAQADATKDGAEVKEA